MSSERRCPLCNSLPTNTYAFAKNDEFVKLPFDQQKCSSLDCELSCNQWDAVQQLAETKEVKPDAS